MQLKILLILLLGILSCQEQKKSEKPVTTPIKEVAIQKELENQEVKSEGDLLFQRILPPNGYQRIEAKQRSFQAYLRNLTLKPEGALVKYYNGEVKHNNGVYHSVVDLKIGSKDLHQCADAVMRLRAEYLWNEQQYEQIHFNFTNGFKVEYKEWMKGRRMVVKGNQTYWNDRVFPSNTYKDFWNYLELIFMYAGTASLEKELVEVVEAEAQIGDILIQGGHPGHAVIIVDKAIHSTGTPIYLLAQSYMPAQELQILNNPNDENLSPWYQLDSEFIRTPEWNFNKEDLKRFRE